jgi:hypothetical protein
LHRTSGQVREYIVDPENLKQVIDPDEPLKITQVSIHITGIETGQQIEIQFFDAGNFIGKKPLKVVLGMSQPIERPCIAKLVHG